MSQLNPEGETFIPKVSAFEMDEEQILQRTSAEPAFGAFRCDLDNEPLGEHTYLKITVRHRRNGDAKSAKVVACTLKEEKESGVSKSAE